MKDLQKIINERAERLATDKVSEFIELFSSFDRSVLNKINITVEIPGQEEKKQTLISLFWTITKPLPKYLIEELTKIYIPIESKKFVEDIERLKNEVDELFDREEN